MSDDLDLDPNDFPEDMMYFKPGDMATPETFICMCVDLWENIREECRKEEDFEGVVEHQTAIDVLKRTFLAKEIIDLEFYEAQLKQPAEKNKRAKARK